MPTYEYQCPEGHVFDKFQKMTDRPRAKCPTCGKPAARKISGGAGLVFRGTGFYITDYGKDGKGPRKEESESRPAAEGKTADSKPAADAKGETKPAPKPESKPAKPGPSAREGKASGE